MAVAQRNAFVGDGEMAALMRACDWAATPLGPVGGWPPSLLNAVNLILESRYPMMVLWGPAFIQFYNDAYRPILGAFKHPGALGASCPTSWVEAWDVIGPLFQSVRDTGEAVWYDDLLLDVDRNGYREETHFACSFSPLRDEAGAVGGVLVTCAETTAQVVSERRLRTLRELAARAATDRAADACAIAAAALADNPADAPFALIYLLDADGGRARLAAAAGLAGGMPASPAVVEFGEPDGVAPAWPFRDVVETGEAIVVSDLAVRVGDLPGGLWPESPSAAVVLPLTQAGRQPIGLFVAGVNPRLALDDAYRGFLELVANQIATAIGHAQTAVGQINHALLRPAHPDGRDAFLRRLQTEEIVEAEVEQTRRDGVKVVVASRQQLIRDGDRLLVLEANRDIAEQARTEAALSESEARLAADLAAMRRLYDLHARLAGETDLRVALGEIVAVANAFLGAARGCIQLVSDDGERLEMFAFRGYDPRDPFIQHFMHEGSKPVCDAARRDRRRLIIEDVAIFPALQGTVDREVALAGGIRAAQSTPMIGRSGELVGVLSTQFPQPHRPTDDELRSIDLLAWTAADFVERHQANEALRQSERQLQQLADAMPQIVWINSADGATITYLNDRWLDYAGDLAGVGLDGRSSEALADSIHPDDRERSAERWRAALASGTAYEAEVRLRGADGGYRWFLARSFPVRDVAGAITRWIGTSTDISALKRAEAALRRSEERLLRAIEIETVGVIYFRTDGAITYANDAFLHMSGYNRDDVARGLVRWDTMTPPEWMPATLRAMDELAESGRISPYEKEYLRQDGSRWWTLCAGTRLSEGEGVKFVLDLTEAKQLEAAHAAVLDAVAHDVKNPLTTIAGQAQMIGRDLARDSIDLDRIQGRAAAIAAGARRATELLDDLTDAARLRAGQPLALQPAPVDLVSLVEAAATTQQSATDRHTIAVEAAVASLSGVWDAARIRRVLDNLLGNAIKYSPDGGPVTVRVRRDDGPDGAWAEVAVVDRGVGIPASDLPRIFEPFHRGGNVAQRIAGSGIGLNGARQIVEQHGGTIAATSVEGQGSVFTARLPLAPDAG